MARKGKSFFLDDDLIEFLENETERRDLENVSQTLRKILRDEKKRQER